MRPIKKSWPTILNLSLIAVLIFSLNACSSQVTSHSTGNIIVLNGTSSSGKSSIAKVFTKENNYVYDAFDNHADKVLAKWIAQKRATSWQSNPQALTYETRLEVLADAQELAAAGNNVLIDMLFDQASDYQLIVNKLKRFNPKFVLVYCPFQVLAERVEARNASGIKSEQRNLSQALSRFGKIYKSAPSGIDELSRADFNAAVKLAKRDFKDPKKYQEFVVELKQNLGFANHTVQTVKIAPRLHYDLIVNTGKNSPQKCAAQIASYLKARAVNTLTLI
jgi:chloramphenicol 3-O-phosphotransferase